MRTVRECVDNVSGKCIPLNSVRRVHVPLLQVYDDLYLVKLSARKGSDHLNKYHTHTHTSHTHTSHTPQYKVR